MTAADRCWRHRLLDFPACGGRPEPGTALLFPEAELPPPADPKQTSCAACASILKTAQRQAEEQSRRDAGPDNALLLRRCPPYREFLWKHRFGPVEPETPAVLAAYQQANLRAAEALDTALYVMGLPPAKAQKYARRAYSEYLQDYASNPEYF